MQIMGMVAPDQGSRPVHAPRTVGDGSCASLMVDLPHDEQSMKGVPLSGRLRQPPYASINATAVLQVAARYASHPRLLEEIKVTGGKMSVFLHTHEHCSNAGARAARA